MWSFGFWTGCVSATLVERVVLRRDEVSKAQANDPGFLECRSFVGFGYHQSGHLARDGFVFVRHRVMVCRQVVILQDVMHFGCEHEVQDGQFGRDRIGGKERWNMGRFGCRTLQSER